MITGSFVFCSPANLADALQALDAEREAVKLVAGGTWVVPNLAGAAGTRFVMDLRRLPLRDIVDDGTHIIIGACVTYAALSASQCIAREVPLLARMAEQITGGPQIRGRGTLGGAVCYANPSSDTPACLLALGAAFTLASARGTRMISASEFFQGAYRTACRPDEMLTAIKIARRSSDTLVAYHKLKICEGSWPIATAACLLQPMASGYAAKIGIGGASPVPLLHEMFLAAKPNDADIRHAARSAASMISEEWCDELGGAGYRRAVAPAVIETALRRALDR